MTEAEIIRRLRALLAMPKEKRPIPIMALASLAGIDQKSIYVILRNDRKLQARTYAKLDRALTMVEQNRVKYRRRGPAKAELILSPPKPPCVTVSRIRFGKDGPKIERVAVNPNAFQVLDEINRKA